jgi:hypothetical protein
VAYIYSTPLRTTGRTSATTASVLTGSSRRRFATLEKCPASRVPRVPSLSMMNTQKDELEEPARELLTYHIFISHTATLTYSKLPSQDWVSDSLRGLASGDLF